MHLLGQPDGFFTEVVIDRDDLPSSLRTIEETSGPDRRIERFFQRHRLRAELDPVPITFLSMADLVFDRDDRVSSIPAGYVESVGILVDLDDVAPS